MLTIRAMAQMGPWILTQVDVLDGRVERCQRCDERIRYVWVMEKQTEPKETWRIGSDCGPALEQVSQELWDQETKPFETSRRHFVALERLAGYERDYPGLRPPRYVLGWAAEQMRLLGDGIITPHQRRVMGSRISQATRNYEANLGRHFRRVGAPT
jgi:hypothetical protein